MEIQFQGQYDKQTIFDAVRMANKPTLRSSLIRIGAAVLMGAILIANIGVIASKESGSAVDDSRLIRMVLSLFILLYFLLQPYLSSYSTASGLWKDSGMQKPLQGAISSRGVTFYSSTVLRRESEWNKFARKRVTEKLIVLLADDGVLTILPRSFFSTDQDWQIAQQWVQSNVVDAV